MWFQRIKNIKKTIQTKKLEFNYKNCFRMLNHSILNEVKKLEE